jgi:hypothetical protein
MRSDLFGPFGILRPYVYLCELRGYVFHVCVHVFHVLHVCECVHVFHLYMCDMCQEQQILSTCGNTRAKLDDSP